MSPRKISHQLLLAGILPAILVAIIIATWVVSLRIADLAENQKRLGQAVVSQLAVAAEYGLFSGNKLLLHRLAEAALEEAELQSVTIRGPDGNTLVHIEGSPHDSDTAGSPARWIAARLAGPGSTARFSAIVTQSVIDLGEFDLQGEVSAPVLGSIEAEIPIEPGLMRQIEAALVGMIIVIAGMLLSLLFASRLGMRIAMPIERLAGAMRRIREGERNVRVPETSMTEIGILESGLNQMADEVTRIQQTLEERVLQATKDLQQTVEALEVSNVELDLARKRAIEVSHLKSDFLAAMSHDIRTPMAGIIGYATLLERTPLTTEQREQVLTIRNSSQSLLQIINNILDLSRIEAGRMTLDHAPFDLRKSLDDTLMLLAPLAYEKHLALSRLVGVDVPWMLKGDATRFQEILVNLISNAIKLTDAGSVTVEVKRIDEHGPAEANIEVVVTDTGQGIPHDRQHQLFQAFSQATTGKARYPGTGLGLLITNQLVELMGGEIRLESELGHGTRISASLRMEVALDTGIHPDSHRGSVFLREPDTMNREHIRQLLERMGFSVHDDLPMERDFCMVVTEETPDSADECFDHPRLLLLVDTLDIASLPKGGMRLVRIASADAISRAIDGIAGGLNRKKAVEGHGRQLDGVAALVVDDHRINRTLLARQLENLGAVVEMCGDGSSAIQACSDRKDVALLDLQMPTMNGVTLAKELGKLGQAPLMVAVTANVLARLDSTLLDAGFAGLLIKPVHDRTLSNHISDLLFRRDEVRTRLGEMDTEILAMLVADLPPLRIALQEASRQQDFEMTGRVLHDLAGIAGACRLCGLEKYVEEARSRLAAGGELPEDALQRILTELVLIEGEAGN